MKNNVSFFYGFCLVILDFVALLGAFVGAYILRVKIDDRPLIEFVSARSFFAVFVVMSFFWVILFALLGLYNSSVYENRFKEFGRLLVGSFVGLLFVLSIAYLSKKPIFPARLVPVYGYLFSLSLLVLLRNIARFTRNRLFYYGIGVTNLLIVGNSKIVKELVDLFNVRGSGYRIVGLVNYDQKVAGINSFKTFEEAIEKLPLHKIQSIIQAELYTSNLKNNQILEFAQRNHIAYRFIPGNTELFIGNIDVELFRSSIPVIAVNQTALSGWGRIIKRLFDVAISLPLLVFLSPIFVLLSLLIIISDFSKPFFSQKRVTRYGRVFNIYKFRTIKKQFNGLSPEEAFKKMEKPKLIAEYRNNGDYLENDPRISAVGKFLRITSLDELPQLWNVMRGDLSLVGPRALVPEELKNAVNKHHITSVKSGLTGLAQVSGRKNISFEERRKLDVYYVQNWTFWTDLVILAKTFRIVINGRGAK